LHPIPPKKPLIGTCVYYNDYGIGHLVKRYALTGLWLTWFLNVPDPSIICQKGCEDCGNGKIHLFLRDEEIIQGMESYNKFMMEGNDL
jgi:hypothetical protein